MNRKRTWEAPMIWKILTHTQNLALDGACQVNWSGQPSEAVRRKHEPTLLPHVPGCTICCRPTQDWRPTFCNDSWIMRTLTRFPKLSVTMPSLKRKESQHQREFFLSLTHQLDTKTSWTSSATGWESIQFDVQERTRVEVDTTSAASAWVLRHSVWLSRSVPTTQGRSNVFLNVSTEVHTDLRFSVVCNSSAWCHRIENMEEFLW